MSDRVTIVDSQNRPLYVSEGEIFRPHPSHVHTFSRLGRRCQICQKTRKQVSQESK